MYRCAVSSGAAARLLRVGFVVARSALIGMSIIPFYNFSLQLRLLPLFGSRLRLRLGLGLGLRLRA